MLRLATTIAVAGLPLLGLVVASVAWAQAAPHTAGPGAAGEGAIAAALVVVGDRVIAYWMNRDKKAAESRERGDAKASRAKLHARMDEAEKALAVLQDRDEARSEAMRRSADAMDAMSRDLQALAREVARLAAREDRDA